MTEATLRAVRSLGKRMGGGVLTSRRGPRTEEGEVQTKAKEGREGSG